MSRRLVKTMSKKLFAAWAKFDPNCPFEFMVEEIEIAHIYMEMALLKQSDHVLSMLHIVQDYLENMEALPSTKNLLFRIAQHIILWIRQNVLLF